MTRSTAAPTQERTHLVYIRAVGAKRFQLLGSGGKVTRLRIHAVRVTPERAAQIAAEINQDNAGEWEAEARPA